MFILHERNPSDPVSRGAVIIRRDIVDGDGSLGANLEGRDMSLAPSIENGFCDAQWIRKDVPHVVFLERGTDRESSPLHLGLPFPDDSRITLPLSELRLLMRMIDAIPQGPI